MKMLNMTLPKTIYAIQHLAFEDMGLLEDIFYQFGFRVRYFEAGIDNLTTALRYDGLTVILGGPISVYDTTDYPFLIEEIALLKQRLADQKPTFGICLGAQLIAHALGANVYAGSQKEIGWGDLITQPVTHNLLAPFHQLKVLHWHGDTFDLPKNATLLASSEHYPHQAFSVGHHVLALQFHLEVMQQDFEKWLIGHTGEIRQAGLSIPQLRQDALQYASHLEQPCKQLIENFLIHLEMYN